MSESLEIGLVGWSMQSSYMRPRHLAGLYREAAEEARRAEELGFDVFWMAEHHHSYDSYCPSLLQAGSYLLAATSRIAIGTAVLVVPLHGAARIAEGLAAIDALAPNRFRVIVGTGYQLDEFAAHGLPLRGRTKVFTDDLEALCGPLADRVGNTEFLSGQVAEAGLKRAGRLGFGMYFGGSDFEEFQRRRAIYEDHFQPRRPGDEPRVVTYVEAWVADDDDRAAWIRGRLFEMWRNYAINWLDVPDFFKHTDDVPWEQSVQTDHAARLEQRDLMAKLVSERFVVGTPAHIVERLRPFVESGLQGVSFRIRFDGVPAADLDRCMLRFATEVVPTLRQIAASA